MWQIRAAALLLLLLAVFTVDMLLGTRSRESASATTGTVVPHAPGEPATWPPSQPFSTSDASSGAGANAVPALDSPGHFPRQETPLDSSALARLPAASKDVRLEALREFPPVARDESTSGVARKPKPDLSVPINIGPATVPQSAPLNALINVKPAQAVRPASLLPGSDLADVQRKLTALGYDTGPADGRFGRRTEAAIRNFQRDMHLDVTGRADDKLVLRLDAEKARRTQIRQQELEVMTPESPPRTSRDHERGVFGTVLGGFQRLLGRDFNSVTRPDEMTQYCRANSDTWIYDFGREAFIYCGNVVAGSAKAMTDGTASR